jgi:hypothetical protein
MAIRHPFVIGLFSAFLAGAAIASAILQKWSGDLVHLFSDAAGSTLIAGFGGAAIGGLISYALALLASRETLKRDAEERTAQEHSSAIRIVVTAIQLLNRAANIHAMVAERAGVAPMADSRLFEKVPGFVGFNKEPPTFETAAFVPFINNGQGRLLQLCSVLKDRVSILDQALSNYTRLREEWDSFAASHAQLQPDGNFSTTFIGNFAIEANARAYKMNDLLRGILQNGPVAVSQGKATVAELHRSYRDYFGNRGTLKIETDQG